jgi:hypothetical protein
MGTSMEPEKSTSKTDKEQTSTAPKRHNCGHAACSCSVDNEISYCSAYCEQAVAHGLERDYCQCEHECAPRFKSTVPAWYDPARTSKLVEAAETFGRRMLLSARTESAVIAVFRDLPEAQAAAAELTANAFAGDHIHLTSDANRSHPCSHSGSRYSGSGRYEGNLDNWLEAMFPEDGENERQRYDEDVRSGKVLLGVTTPQQMLDTAADILHHQSPIDLRVHRDRGELRTVIPLRPLT